MRITLRPFQRNDLTEYRSWFEDEELSRRLAYPTDEWFAHVSAGDAARSWAASANGQLVAQVQADREGPRGYIDFAVRPGLRGQGIGTAVLGAFLSGPGQAYPILDARIEPDNLASLGCCARCGFTLLDHLDAEGFAQAVYVRAKAGRTGV